MFAVIMSKTKVIPFHSDPQGGEVENDLVSKYIHKHPEINTPHYIAILREYERFLTTREKKKGKPIELVKCLQINTCVWMKVHEYVDRFSNLTKIEQLTTGGKYDGMDVIMTIELDAPVMWLGHWNDGYIEDNE
jgi:hypothetical protein